ncbi:hypothetical protein Acr_19g0006060 [Actinidia rufa]|uniref:RING-type domain-containing protein n=1 Tax=Actinidia rufa TaxID=165716 RepID=A0A7J0GA53_9ERIC|nr:hypothetical protein Acr_19g0006060 [Actinidia rufa]
MASDSETSPNKRRKTLAQPPTSSSSSPPTSSSGASREIDGDGPETLDSESRICGICLSESGNGIRGRIDSCDHHFCFVCIMEWAKVESRCPLCKRRFGNIRRPPKDGVFLTERAEFAEASIEVKTCNAVEVDEIALATCELSSIEFADANVPIMLGRKWGVDEIDASFFGVWKGAQDFSIGS